LLVEALDLVVVRLIDLNVELRRQVFHNFAFMNEIQGHLQVVQTT
jgi:hypothetical protein